MKNSSYKERPSRGADPAGLALLSHPQDAWQPGTHSESQPCPLFYSKTGTGRTGLFPWGAGRLCDLGYLQHGNFTLGNISFLQSPHGRNLKSYDRKKNQGYAALCISTCANWKSGPWLLCALGHQHPVSPVKGTGAAGAPSPLLARRSRYKEQNPSLPATWSAAALCVFMPALM